MSENLPGPEPRPRPAPAGPARLALVLGKLQAFVLASDFSARGLLNSTAVAFVSSRDLTGPSGAGNAYSGQSRSKVWGCN
jgi:hypothetical protein